MTTKNETIVDRVVSRLQSQPLGDLITEEDLHDIVKEAIPRAFFAKRRVTDGSGYSAREIEKEPLITEIMRGLVRPTVEAAVKQWLVENAEVTQEYWKKVLDAGLLKYVREIEDAQATSHVSLVVSKWIEVINQERSKNGLPYLMV